MSYAACAKGLVNTNGSNGLIIVIKAIRIYIYKQELDK